MTTVYHPVSSVVAVCICDGGSPTKIEVIGSPTKIEVIGSPTKLRGGRI